MASDKKVRVGVIGAGGVSTGVHLPALRLVESAEVIAVCDIIEDRAKHAAESFSIPETYTLYGEMLAKSDLDAVFVLTEPDQLYRPAKVCLEAGKHVFMEKPPGVTTYQAQTLLRTAREADRILQVGFNRRFIPLVRHVVDLMKEHTAITQVEGRFFKQGEAAFYGGCSDAFRCDAIHSADLVRWIAGGEPAAAATVEGQTNDVVPNRWNAVVRFDTGIVGTVRANYQTGARVHSLEIHGPKASAFVNLGFGDASCSAEILFVDGEGTHSLASAGPGSSNRLSIDGIELAGSDEFCVYQGFLAEDEHFIGCIQNGQLPLTGIEDAVKTMQFVDLMEASII